MSFAQEIKDFVNGYKSVSEMKSQKKLRDAQADYYENMDKNATGSSLTLDANTEAYRKRLLGNIQKITSSAPKAKVSMAPDTGVSKVAMSGNDDENTTEANDGNDSTAIPQVAAARGGMIPAVKAGGGGNIVAPAPDEDETSAPAASAIPADSPADLLAQNAVPASNKRAALPAPADNSASNSPSNPISGLFDAAGHVINKVMHSFTQDSKGQGALGGKGSDIDWNSMSGSASPAEVKAMDQAFDPDGTLSKNQKGAARLVSAYQYFMDRGEPEKAVNVAKRIVLYDKMVTMASGKIAQTQLQDGDVQGAADTVANAYNTSIHDGHEVQAKANPDGTINMTVMKDGKKVQQQTVDTSALWAASGDLASGKAALQYYAQIAGMSGSAKGKGGSGSGSGSSGSSVDAYDSAISKVGDTKKALNTAQDAYDNASDDEAKKKAKAALDAAKAANDKAVADAKKIGSSVSSKDMRHRKDILKDIETANKTGEMDGTEEEPTSKKKPSLYETYIAPHLPDIHWGSSRQSAPAQPQQAVPTQPASAPQQAVPTPQRPPAQTGIAVPPAVISQAKDAIAKGAPRDAVIQRLRSAGYNVEGL